MFVVMDEKVSLDQTRLDDNRQLQNKEDVQAILLDCSTFVYPQNAESSSIIGEFSRHLEELILQWHYRCPDGRLVPLTDRPIEIEIPDEIIQLIEHSSSGGHEDNPGPRGRSGTELD